MGFEFPWSKKSAVPDGYQERQYMEQGMMEEEPKPWYRRIADTRRKKIILVVVGLAIVGIIIAILWRVFDTPSTETPQGKERKLKRIENEEFLNEHNQQNLQRLYEKKVQMLQALQTRARENQIEAKRNSDNYDKAFVLDSDGALEYSFLPPEVLEKKKQGMILLAEELKEEMKFLDQEYERVYKEMKKLEQYLSDGQPMMMNS